MRTRYIFFAFLFSQWQGLFAQEDNPPSFYHQNLGRGMAFIGISGGASLRESENENALIVTILNQRKSGFNALLTGGYLIKPNLAIGGGLRYDQSRLAKTTEDGDGVVTDIKEAGNILTSSVYLKYFIPLTSNHRINLFNIAGVAWVADRNTRESFGENILTRTFTSKNTFQLGLNPGVQAFVIEGFATEVSVSVAGLSGSRKKVIENGVERSSVDSFDVDLKLNILSLNISFYYYFPTNKKSSQ
jgi:hypothetical protein